MKSRFAERKILIKSLKKWEKIKKEIWKKQTW